MSAFSAAVVHVLGAKVWVFHISLNQGLVIPQGRGQWGLATCSYLYPGSSSFLPVSMLD